ncbi:M24 family metallopeptidase [Sphingomonas sp.]|uniref:M24 family metallopeptidase n=1 Tax=Sphingomonas sp. TaxID=28214 RepID=UPI003B3B4DA3
MLNRRTFVGSAGMVAAGAALSVPAGAQSRDRVLPTGAESAKLFIPKDDLEPGTFDRLPLSFYKERMQTLQARLARAGVEGVVLTDQWNIIYFTGLFHTTTERMIHCFIPTKGTSPVWFYPALDRDLIQTWWYDDGEMYFDWLDVAGAMPQEGKLVKGPTRDLWAWLLEGVKKRGFAGKKLAVDRELVPSRQKTVVEVLGQPMISVANDCMFMRQRKTPQELALMRRAYTYFDQIHAFARDLIMTYGTDLTDYEIGNLAQDFGTQLVLKDIKRDGKPHNAVGISVGVKCRIGQATGYPHPNQFFYNKIERGKAFQVAGGIRIGGYGGELYRPYMIAPRTGHMEKVWRTARDGCVMQKDLSRKGTLCSDVAYAIHKMQIDQGMQKYIYHRPAHGSGMEGHQPPYLALGDHTVLDTGMCFSVEPGLFDPETGTGANFSDTFVVRESGPSLQMSRLPYSEEWSFIKI